MGYTFKNVFQRNVQRAVTWQTEWQEPLMSYVFVERFYVFDGSQQTSEENGYPTAVFTVKQIFLRTGSALNATVILKLRKQT